ncbi:carbohydrate ABC transporter permease [Devosia rhodophyticola]|uniref:Carbohydrate ABC transporter permease n=1 Tax=Devosia rhodophyticola TaxID=3026423 RepID=A0ABY7YYR1_9HYPH|nr:carbohydrate ABC transporter permease [Devosia rhodophyticola]WDR06501.1 carbohydrate ABC transporter permease [Devosia rhodophyticola]
MTALSLADRRRRGAKAVRTRLFVGIARSLFLAILSLMVLVPIAYMVLASFKTVPDFFGNPYGLPGTWAWDNYSRAWRDAHISITLPNTIIVTAVSVFGSTLLAALIAYGISRKEKPFAMGLYTFFVAGLLVPVNMIVLPLFILIKWLGLFGTLMALIFPYIALGLPLGVLILGPVAATLPRDLISAAQVDGATEWQIFRRIVLPLMKPGLISVAILNGVWMWNEFFIPLIVAFKPESQTMPVGIVSFVGAYSTEWGLVFASVVVSTAPILFAYLLMTRQFQSGLTAGAVKG